MDAGAEDAGDEDAGTEDSEDIKNMEEADRLGEEQESAQEEVVFGGSSYMCGRNSYLRVRTGGGWTEMRSAGRVVGDTEGNPQWGMTADKRRLWALIDRDGGEPSVCTFLGSPESGAATSTPLKEGHRLAGVFSDRFMTLAPVPKDPAANILWVFETNPAGTLISSKFCSMKLPFVWTEDGNYAAECGPAAGGESQCGVRKPGSFAFTDTLHPASGGMKKSKVLSELAIKKEARYVGSGPGFEVDHLVPTGPGLEVWVSGGLSTGYRPALHLVLSY